MASPLFGLLAKDYKFTLYSLCQGDFELINRNLTTGPILRGPNWNFPFNINTDSSEKVVGETLGKLEDTLPYEIYFISNKFPKNEHICTLTEKEMLGIIIYKLCRWVSDLCAQ